MKKLKAVLLKESIVKDSKGNTTKTFVNVNEIWIDDILPISVEVSRNKTGFHEKTTHFTKTFEFVSSNSFLEAKGKRYYITKVTNYPIFNYVELEGM